MKLALTLLMMIAFIFLIVLLGLSLYLKYKNDPSYLKAQVRTNLHGALLSGVKTAKELAKVEVINVATDDNLPSGGSKKAKAVSNILAFLSKHNLDSDEALVSRIVEATYQTYKDFLKKNHIDSRTRETPVPNGSNPLN